MKMNLKGTMKMKMKVKVMANMKTKKIVMLAIVLLLALSPVTACSGNDSDSGGNDGGGVLPGSQESAPSPGGDAAEDGGEDDSVTFSFNDVWFLEARIEDMIDVGAMKNLAGIYSTYLFDIEMSHIGPDPAGDYYLDMDASITTNSDEAADSLLSAYLGGDVEGMELGLNGYSSAQIELNDDPLKVSKKAPSHMIKDKDGRQVSLEGMNYFMEEDIKVPYKGDASVPIVGDLSAEGEETVRIFVAFSWDYDPEYDSMDASISDYFVPVKVYLTYPARTAEGTEIWHSGEGTLTRHSGEYSVGPEDYSD